jgi:hypothetical protein
MGRVLAWTFELTNKVIYKIRKIRQYGGFTKNWNNQQNM